MDNVNAAIWRKFHVHRHDSLPYIGFYGGRTVLAELFAELGYTRGAEIGVQIGTYSEVLCQKIPNLHLLCVDPWHSYNLMAEKKAEDFYEQAKARLAPYDVEMIRKRSMDAVVDVPDESLDFVYIDGLHEFDPVILDLIHWSRKVRRGGIVAGHDYLDVYQGGVIDAVRAFVFAHNINPWYVTRDRPPSYFWPKWLPTPTRYW